LMSKIYPWPALFIQIPICDQAWIAHRNEEGSSLAFESDEITLFLLVYRS